MVWP